MSKNFKETLCKNRKMEPFHTGYAFKDGLCASCYIEQQAEEIEQLKGLLYDVASTNGDLSGTFMNRIMRELKGGE